MDGNEVRRAADGAPGELKPVALHKPRPRAGYRPPQVVVLGKAARLMRQSINGHLTDGGGGWWVWGS
jgi:hypothetical protein